MPSMVTYGRLVKFSHTVFAMPFALLGAVLAGASRGADFASGRFWARFALVVACMVCARSAAMAFNRIADRRIDAGNPRTADRPIQSGRLTLRQAWGFYAVCSGAFVLLAGGFWAGWGNYWPIVFAGPVLGYLSVYSLAKRFTSLCHLLLGAALGLSPVAAWVAVAPATFGAPALVLGGAVACWVAAFDIIYALQDLDFDVRRGLHSLPVAVGPANALWISRALHLTAVTALLWVWALSAGRLGRTYLAGVGVAGVVLAVEQALVSPRNFSRVNVAFFTCNGVVSVVLGAAGIADVLAG